MPSERVWTAILTASNPTGGRPIEIRPLAPNDPRLTQPLFLVREAAVYLGVPPSTFETWVHGYERPTRLGATTHGKPIVTSVPGPARNPTIPLIGAAEGLALNAFRRAGVPLQRIRPALAHLERELGLEHVLASDRLYTDGAEVLYDYGRQEPSAKVSELVVVRKQQRVFVPIVEQYLRHIQYGADHWAEQLKLPGYEAAGVVIDLKRGFGRPIVERARVPVEELVDRWWAGDSIRILAEDFGLSEDEVEDVIRAATRVSAAA